jgi:hypothetical protein
MFGKTASLCGIVILASDCLLSPRGTLVKINKSVGSAQSLSVVINARLSGVDGEQVPLAAGHSLATRKVAKANAMLAAIVRGLGVYLRAALLLPAGMCKRVRRARTRPAIPKPWEGPYFPTGC